MKANLGSIKKINKTRQKCIIIIHCSNFSKIKKKKLNKKKTILLHNSIKFILTICMSYCLLQHALKIISYQSPPC